MENAISVGHHGYKKIFVDFADQASVCHAVLADRIMHIDTPGLHALSDKLGIPLIGYADRDGLDVNNWTACRLTGYSSMGSDMILCKTDEQKHLLPFDRIELEIVYTYLAKGKRIPYTKNRCAFFAQNDINPTLHDFPLPPCYRQSELYPDLLLITYEIPDDVDVMLEYMDELLVYRDELALRYTQNEDTYLANDGSHLIYTGWENDYCLLLICIVSLPSEVTFEEVKQAYSLGLFIPIS